VPISSAYLLSFITLWTGARRGLGGFKAESEKVSVSKNPKKPEK
jgi:hypothetical protein